MDVLETNNLLVTGPIRSGTTLVSDEVSKFILGVPHRAEITPLSDVLALTHRWSQGYESTRFIDWLAGKKIGEDLEDLALEALMHPPRIYGKSGQRLWWVAKDPLLCHYPERLSGLVSRTASRLLLCIRDPLDVMASALEVQARQTYGHTRKHYFDTVWKQYEGLLKLLKMRNLSELVYAVTYEGWVTNPKQHRESIATWLGTNCTSTPKSGYRRTFLDMTDPYLTPLYYAEPSTSSIGRFRSSLEEPVLHYLADIFSGVRRELGYKAFAIDKKVSEVGKKFFFG